KDLSIATVGTGYTLNAAVGGSDPLGSSSFDVGAPATQLVFTQTATGVTPDGGKVPAVAVSVEDASGHVVASDNTTQVTLRFGVPAGQPGGNLYGVLTEKVSNGVAVF